MGKVKLLKEFKPGTKKDWEAEAKSALKGQLLSKLTFKTADGLTIQPYYTTDDIKSDSPVIDLPGLSPYRRGINTSAYMDKSWLVCQEINLYDPVEFSEVLSDELKKGLTAVHLKPLNLQHSFSEQVSGTYIADYNDFEIALKDIDITIYPLYLELGTTTFYVFDYLLDYLKAKQYSVDVEINIIFDPFAELADKGKIYAESVDIYKSIKILIEKTKEFKNIKLLGLNSVIFRNKGAEAVQELAFSIACALDFIYNLSDDTNSIDSIAQKIHFTLSSGNDFFEEIAKFRAARVIWSKLIQSMGGNEESRKMNIRAVTPKFNKSVIDRHTNMLRTTTETLAAIIGGCQTITVLPYQNLSHSENEFSRRAARNTQLVLGDECNLKEVIDPAGGSWFIENLTNEMIDATWNLINKIEDREGFYNALLSEYIKSIVDESKAKKINNVRTRKNVFIGVNKFSNNDENNASKEHKEFLSNAEAYRKRIEKGKNLLDNLKIIEIEKFDDLDLSKQFFELKKRVEKINRSKGIKPQIFLAGFGPSKQFKARMDFTKEFLSVAGLTAVESGELTIENAKDKFIESGMDIIVLCSTDDTYTDIVKNVVTAIKQSNPSSVAVLAGYPKDIAEKYKEYGIDEFIHIKADIYMVLSKLISRLDK